MRPRVIGEVDLFSAPTLVHDGAIYLHESRQFHVDRLDWEERKAYVRPVDGDHYTQAESAVTLKPLERFAFEVIETGERAHGEVMVSRAAERVGDLRHDRGPKAGRPPLVCASVQGCPLMPKAFLLGAAPPFRGLRGSTDLQTYSERSASYRRRFSAVSNAPLFYAIAAISTSFAGFAGLYLALRPHDAAWEEYEVSQVRTIIFYGLTALFGSLLLVPLADLIDESLALRVMSAGLLVVVFYGHQVRVGTSWTRWPTVRRDLSQRALIIQMAPFVLVAVADQVLLLANLVAPTEGLYQLALILILATPALVFVTVVSRFGSSAEG